jgi:ABC-type cobalamin/Fe3+-siderophores transport system ATPase subunit
MAASLTAEVVSTILGFLTCESRQQAIEDASGDHCQLIVIANALSQAGEDTLDTGASEGWTPPTSR